MNSSPELSASEKMKAASPRSRSLQPSNPLIVFLTGLLTTALVFGGCACGVGLFWFRPITTDNPERAREVTHEIVSIRIPPTFVPKGTIEWNVFFVLRMRGVYYERLAGEGLINLLEVNTRLATDEMVRNHIRQTLLEDLPTGSSLIIDPVLTRRETLEVNGEQVVFSIDLATDPKTKETYRILEGVFAGNNGQVLLTMRVNSNRWLDEIDPNSDPLKPVAVDPLPHWVEAMITSIGRPGLDAELVEDQGVPIPFEDPLLDTVDHFGAPKDAQIPIAPNLP